MPELPEVENFRIYFDTHALNQTIQKVEILDSLVVNHVEPEEFSRFLIGMQFQKTYRHGKFIFVTISSKFWVVFHFGMTGNLNYYPSSQNLHKHDRVVFYFNNGNKLVYRSQRKFGRVLLTHNISNFLREHRFGPDALGIDLQSFENRIKNRSRPIKSLLLDQSFIAGIGNLYADEILFQLKINPKNSSSLLSEDAIIELFHKIQEVLQKAVDFGVTYGKFPPDFFINMRGNDNICPRCQANLEHIKIGGRTSYFCPKCQKKFDA